MPRCEVGEREREREHADPLLRVSTPNGIETAIRISVSVVSVYIYIYIYICYIATVHYSIVTYSVALYYMFIGHAI